MATSEKQSDPPMDEGEDPDDGDTEEQKRLAEEIYAEARARAEAKRATRKENLEAAENRPDEAFFRKLDSSVKKNSALVKKLRANVVEAQQKALLNDISKCNLTKYIPEVVAAVASLPKQKKVDTPTVVAISSLLHQRYDGFSEPLAEALRAGFVVPSEEDKEGISTLRTTLRLYTELVVAGVFSLPEFKHVINILDALVKQDEEHNCLSVITSFCKHCGPEVAGILSRKQLIQAERFGLSIAPERFLPPEAEEKVRSLLIEYFAGLSKHLEKSHKALQKVLRNNQVTIQLRGELTPQREEETDTLHKNTEKLLSSTTVLADLLAQDMPELPEENPDEMFNTMSIDISNPYKHAEYDASKELWEDNETRIFYESITDLRSKLPKVLFDVKTDPKEEEGTEEAADAVAEETAAAEAELEAELGKLDEESLLAEGDEAADAEGDEGDDPEAATNLPIEDEEPDQPGTLSARDQFALLLDRLPTCINRDMIDQAAIDFCHLNTKSKRKQLALALFQVKNSRQDLLPYYARLVATLHPAMPDLAEELVSHLQGEFRFHVRKRIQDKLDSKTRNIRFIAELTKFKVCPVKVPLLCLQTLLRQFSHHNIEVACALLESCGRFLFRSPDTHVRTKLLLDIMMKKKTALHLDERMNALIENALYYCNPPAHVQAQRKVRPPIQEYLRKLLHKDLGPSLVEKILIRMRKMPWSDPEFVAYTIKSFVRVWRLKYNNVHCLASLLAGIAFYHDDFALKVIDAILEEIRVGMEVNKPEYNQRRVSTVKYAGELYNYRLLDSKVIFNTLYSLITFAANSPTLDAPDNYFRLKLVCTLLDACGQYFDRGSDRVRLDSFLTYFQRYMFTKAQPLPVDVDIMVHDTLELLRPKLQLFDSLEAAGAAVQALEEQTVAKLKRAGVIKETAPTEGAAATAATQNPPELISSESEESDDDEAEEGGAGDGEEAEAAGEADESTAAPQDGDDDDDDDDSSESEDDEEDEVVVLKNKQKAEPDLEDLEFMEEFNKMMSETMHSRRNDAAAAKVQTLDVSIPLHLKGAAPKTVEAEEGSRSHKDKKVLFTFLTRKGAKQGHQELAVPMDSSLADRMFALRQEEKAELQRNKQFVMEYEQRANEEELAALRASVNGRFLSETTRNDAGGRRRRQRRPQNEYRGGEPVFRPE